MSLALQCTINKKCIVVVFLLSAQLYGQSISRQVVSSSGLTAKNGNVNLEYSTGQVVTATFRAGRYDMIVGFHQHLRELLTSAERPTATVQIYPTVTLDAVTVDFMHNHLKPPIAVKVHDSTGKLLSVHVDESVPGIRTVDMTGLNSGIYLLQVSANGRFVKVVRILKL